MLAKENLVDLKKNTFCGIAKKAYGMNAGSGTCVGLRRGLLLTFLTIVLISALYPKQPRGRSPG